MADINLKLNLAAEKDTVMADPEQLRQVFVNLIINAADAIASSQTVINGEIIITSKVLALEDQNYPQNSFILKIIFQ